MHFEDMVAAYSRMPLLRRKPSLLRLVGWAERLRGAARTDKTALVETPRGAVRLKVDLRAWLQREIFYHGVFEPDTQRFLHCACRPGYTVVDVGANIGVYTVQMSRLVGKDGHVYAFEPTAVFYEQLQQNLRLNECRNVTCEKLIVSNSDAPQQITATDQTASINLYSQQGTTETVASVTLDQYFADHEGRLDVLKIDVDGWDYHVLEGAGKTLSRFRPAIVVECLSYGPIPPIQMWNLLKAADYSLSLDTDPDRSLAVEEFEEFMRTTPGVNLIGIPK